LRHISWKSQLDAARAVARFGEVEKRVEDLNAELGRVNQHSSGLLAALTDRQAVDNKTAATPVARVFGVVGV
jgi:hypothetical protein